MQNKRTQENLLTDKQKQKIWTMHLTGQYFQREIAEIVGVPLHRVNLYVKNRTLHPCLKCKFCVGGYCAIKRKNVEPNNSCSKFKIKN